MTSNEAMVLGLVVVAVVATRRKRRRHLRMASSAAATDNPGLAITVDDVDLLSWDRWMAKSPQAIKAAMAESDKPEEIVTNVFRRLYPNVAWPPPEGTGLWMRWQAIVAAVGRTLDRPFKTHMHVVS
jgi:hypothetical protein